MIAGTLSGCQAAGSAPEAICVEPSLSAEPGELIRGESFELIGSGFVCNDAFYNGEPAGQKEGRALPVVLEQGGEVLPVGTVEIDDQGAFATKLITPDGAATGAGQLVVEGVSVSITVE